MLASPFALPLVSDAWSRGSHIATVRAKYMASEWWRHHHCTAFNSFCHSGKYMLFASAPAVTTCSLSTQSTAGDAAR